MPEPFDPVNVGRDNSLGLKAGEVRLVTIIGCSGNFKPIFFNASSVPGSAIPTSGSKTVNVGVSSSLNQPQPRSLFHEGQTLDRKLGVYLQPGKSH